MGRTRSASLAFVGAAAIIAAGVPAAAQDTMSMDELVAAAQAEGTLTTIALPHDWCNYGEMISTFKSKYGLQVNELNPDAGSGDEIEAIKANKLIQIACGVAYGTDGSAVELPSKPRIDVLKLVS